MSEARPATEPSEGVRCKHCPHVSHATEDASAEAVHADHMSDVHQDILRAIVGGVS